LRVADYIFDYLSSVGVKNVFGVTGRGSLFLSDAVARRNDMNFVPLHHEQSAGYAAAGVSLLSGSLSVCLVSTGVGASNAVSACLGAFQDQLPVLFLSGQNTSHQCSSLMATRGRRTFGEQEFDVVGMVRSITKSAMVLENPKLIRQALPELIMTATSGRPGPVWLDIPLDFQSATVAPSAPSLNNARPQSVGQQISDARLIDFLANDPLILLGQGATFGNFRKLAIDFIAECTLKVVSEAAAADVGVYAGSRYLGTVGILGSSREGNQALSEASHVLSLGSTYRLGLVSESPHNLTNQAHLSIDYDDIELPIHDWLDCDYLGPPSESLFQRILRIASERASTSTPLREEMDVGMSSEPADNEDLGVDLHDLARLLPQICPKETVFVTDSGLIEVIFPNHALLQTGQRLVHPYSQGSMGYALGAVVGCSRSLGTDGNVVAIVGDGSLMMNLQELESIRTHSRGAKVVVIENDMYAIIRKRQTEVFRGRIIGTDQTNGVTAPDFEKVAKVFDFHFHRVENLEDLMSVDWHGKKSLMVAVRGLREQKYLSVGRSPGPEGSIIPGSYDSMIPKDYR
jgi:acetolactate synthase I/II/III large subunit